tara:strand:- start:298 stop:561 length:264 start_codon:yes stop_codon:yes gene_type:complete
MATYEIADDLTVRFWETEDTSGEPYLVQPTHPSGYAWIDAEHVNEWAERRLGIYIEPVVEVTQEEPLAIEATPEEAPAEEEPNAETV